MKPTKKTVGKIVISLILVVALAVGGLLAYWVRTPEYALYRTYQDVQTSGVEGLKPHLTGNASLVVEGVGGIMAGLSGLFSQYTEGDGDVAALLMEHFKEVDWTVEDVLRGREQSSVVLGFAYQGEFSGTVRVDLTLVEGEWLISGISGLSVD